MSFYELCRVWSVFRPQESCAEKVDQAEKRKGGAAEVAQS